MRGEYAGGDTGLTPPSRLGQTPITSPFDAPVSLLGIDHRAAGLEVDALRPIDVHVGCGRQQLASGAVERVLEAVLVERDEDLS